VSKENLTALLPTSKKQRASVAKQILCGQEKIQHQNREIKQGKILVVLRPAADSRQRAKLKRKVLVEVMQTRTGGNLARTRQVLLVLM
jgi:hypothetical protein